MSDDCVDGSGDGQEGDEVEGQANGVHGGGEGVIEVGDEDVLAAGFEGGIYGDGWDWRGAVVVVKGAGLLIPVRLSVGWRTISATEAPPTYI